MTSSAGGADGAEDVNAFLQRIRDLGETPRDREDEERTRKLEDEILQGRKERQARRAERARSISPTKDSPLGRSSFAASTSSQTIEPPVTFDPPTPNRQNPVEQSMDRLTGRSLLEGRRGSTAEDLIEPEMPKPPAQNSNSPRASPSGSPTRASTLSRSGTLSWQQRPKSRGAERPRSFQAANTSRSSAVSAKQTTDLDAEPSRNQIAQSLGSKDPSWFRQTPDRGIGSAAYRKSQDELTSADAPSTKAGMKLPGMTRESTVDSTNSTDTNIENTREVSEVIPTSLVQGRKASNGLNKRNDGDSEPPKTSGGRANDSTTNLTSTDSISSDGPGSVPATVETDAERLAMSPAQGRLLSDRPPSPTKGMGGFVQSAMLRRSDSISKRWSAQSGPGISRGNSMASIRGLASPASPASVDLRPSGLDRSGSFVSNSRPESGQGISQEQGGNERPQTPVGASRPDSSMRARQLARSNSIVKDDSNASDSDSYFPVVQSKTMDPKRWSPTKASWLESAINRPDSPTKQQRPAMSPQQPSWMTDLQKSRQQRSSVDIGRGSFKEVNVGGGLMRSPPPGGSIRPMSINGLPEGFNSGLVKRGSVSDEVKKETDDAASLESATKTEPSPAVVSASPEPSSKSPEPITDIKPDVKSPISPPKEESTRSPVHSPISHSLRSSPGIRPEKPKPETPPKDFRSSLRSRPLPSDSSKNNEPEFKNMFGKLKKTETKNYVAPDTFKDNITRGKAALNLTGGPQKTKRVDEFKESILKQKEAMKAGGGTALKKDPSSAEKPEEKVPEALARRKHLSRSNSIFGVDSNKEAKPVAATPLPLRQSLRDSTKAGSNEGRMSTSSDTSKASWKRESSAAASESKSPESEGAPESELSKTQTANKPKESAQPVSLSPALSEVKLKDAPLQLVNERASSGKSSSSDKPMPLRSGAAAGGKLANRLNPALAGLLSRGPPKVGESSQSPERSSTDLSSSIKPTPSEDAAAGQLTHMTKSRARGPKRRLPKATAAEVAPPAEPVSSSRSVEASAQLSSNPQTVTSVPARVGKVANVPPQPRSPSSSVQKSMLPNSPKIDTIASDAKQEKPKPAVSAKSPELRRVSVPKPEVRPLQDGQSNKGFDLGSGPSIPPLGREVKISPAPGSVTSRKMSDDKENVKDIASMKLPLKDRAAMWSQAERPSSPKQVQARSESPRVPQKKDISLEKAPGGQSVLPIGLGISSVISSEPTKTPKSAPTVAKKSEAVKNRVPSSTTTSPVPQTSEATRTITEFFDSKPTSRQAIQVDAQMILSRPGAYSKVKTLRMQIWEITGDGKRQDLPAGQEYILFEESMYLCVHNFEPASGGKAAEVYLWYGDGVGEAALQDAQIFARKIAKDNSCKLDLLKQGKETANFFQALGGIVVVRRGSSSRHSSSSMYMLRGRQHLGQVAFDETDLTVESLCSGFPYIISAQYGKLFLWKGKGSGAEELGCARLIGMDLGLTGEMEEITEGDEPDFFFESLAKGNRTQILTSDHWVLKGNHSQYRCRLYRVDSESRPSSSSGLASALWSLRSSSPRSSPSSSIQEIEPFCQADLAATNIYVLDTFFEIILIVGDQASSKSIDFVTALAFAQEYGILAASVQDRPFIPISKVVFRVPDDVRPVFRKWDTIERLSVGKSVAAFQDIPLSAAIEATRE